MVLLYNIVLFCTAPIWLTWTWWRARQRQDPPNWNERFGIFPFSLPRSKRRVWLHAVSVGEVIAALPILRELRADPNPPEVILSVTTSSGHRTAAERAVGLFDHLVYMPIDMVRFQLSAMARVKPNVVAIMETELWMSFLWTARQMRATTILLNGRISDRSFPRAMTVRFFYKALFKYVDFALMQTETDADRIRKLGAARVEVLGNCKFDELATNTPPDPDYWRNELKILPEETVIVIGSTRGDEEDRLVIDAIRRLDWTNLRVIHAPRHLERADALAELAVEAGLTVGRRTLGETAPYLILDTYGELGAVYSVANFAVIGGGFSNLGGQNLIQPLALGKPVIHGPHMQNFAEVAQLASRADCTAIAETSDDLLAHIRSWRDHPDKVREMGLRASTAMANHSGASARYADAILKSL